MARLTIAALSMLAMTPAASSGQSLIVSGNSEWRVAASYAYSQQHHDDAWILIDVGLGSEHPWTIRPHEAFYLLTPEGERIDLPDQRAYRRGRNSIRSMYARAVTMQLSPWLAFTHCRVLPYVGWSEARQATADDWNRLGRVRLSGEPGCLNWRLWGNSDIDWTATLNSGASGGASLFFESPSGTWADGEYTLVVSGPGDSVARLPINLIAPTTY